MRECSVSAYGRGHGAGQPAGMVRREDNHHGAAGGGADGVKKAMLIIALVLGVAVIALAWYYRLHMILLIMRSDLPGWLKMFLWGWH